MTALHRFAALLVAALVFAGCTGVVGPPPPPDPPPPPPEEPVYPSYETFDPSGYDAPPRSAAPEVRHDVPARLMEGRVDVPGSSGERTVDGFRVQVFSSESRTAAEQARDEGEAWWREVRGTRGAPSNLTSDIAYIQPYYRVRLGAFEFREEAEAALRFVRERFPQAFIVPDRVRIRD